MRKTMGKWKPTKEENSLKRKKAVWVRDHNKYALHQNTAGDMDSIIFPVPGSACVQIHQYTTVCTCLVTIQLEIVWRLEGFEGEPRNSQH